MRTRSCTVSLLALLGCFGLTLVASPAFAAPKKKKKAAAAAETASESGEEPSVDDLMKESTSKKQTSSAESDSAAAEPAPAEEEWEEPDAWERPPMEEEKPKDPPKPVVEEKYGDGRRIEIGLAPAFGFQSANADWATLDPYSLGLGLRGGYELDNRIFLGAGFVYHLGSSDSLTVNTPGAPTAGIQETRQNYMLAYLEGGYDFWFDSLLVRPSMWLGMGFAIVDPYLTTGGVRTVSDFLFAPGINLLYVFDGIYIGGDVRWVVVTGDGAAGVDFFGVIGLRF